VVGVVGGVLRETRARGESHGMRATRPVPFLEFVPATGPGAADEGFRGPPCRTVGRGRVSPIAGGNGEIARLHNRRSERPCSSSPTGISCTFVVRGRSRGNFYGGCERGEGLFVGCTMARGAWIAWARVVNWSRLMMRPAGGFPAMNSRQSRVGGSRAASSVRPAQIRIFIPERQDGGLARRPAAARYRWTMSQQLDIAGGKVAARAKRGPRKVRATLSTCGGDHHYSQGRFRSSIALMPMACSCLCW